MKNNNRQRKRRVPERERVKKRFFDRLNMWRLGFSVDGETVLKGVVIGVIMVVLTLLQTTFLTRFKPLGIVPDLLLPFTIAVGVSEREKWGAVTGLIAAVVIDAVGGSTIMLLPLLYVPAGYICGLLTVYRFRNTFPVLLTYTVISSLLRGIITMIIAYNTINGIAFGQVLVDKVLPELPMNILFAAIPHIIVRLSMKPFHKSREERTGGI